MRGRGVIYSLLCPDGVCARPSRNNMTAHLGYGSYPALIGSGRAPEDSLHPDVDCLCLSGSGVGDWGRIRNPVLICYGWGERIPRPDTA